MTSYMYLFLTGDNSYMTLLLKHGVTWDKSRGISELQLLTSKMMF